jgi:hypothetical protein
MASPHRFSRYPQIEAVMFAAAERLAKIEVQYGEALHSQQIPEPLLVQVKAYLGDLRSALDYLNQKIPNSDRYFPICAHPNDFAARFGQVDPTVSAVLERWQPYNGNDWLKWFNVLNNKNKHVTLVPQTRREMARTTVSHPGGGSLSWGPGVTFGEGISVMGVPIDPRTQLPVPNNIVRTERIVWVDFLFDQSVAPEELPAGLSALPFLKELLDKIAVILKEVEGALESVA